MNKKSGQIRYAGGKGQSGMTPGLKQADLGKSALKKQPLLKAPQNRKINDRTMKKKSAAVAVEGGLHPIRSHPLRAALIVAVYLLAFIILDMITQKYEDLPGVVTWYPPSGLTYALLLACGVGFTPAVTIALFISSLFIYRMPQPAHLLFLWAFIISLIYGAAAALLRRVIHFDWQLRKFRDVAWFIFMTVLVSALLAVLSVSSSALSSDMPRSEVVHSIFHWWIGETIGVLTITPFLLIFIMPALKRFMEGQLIKLLPHSPFSHFTPAVIAQAFTLIFMLYWVFGGKLFQDEMHPLYLISLPLIWIALDHGFRGATMGVLVMNFGVMFALSVFRTDLANLGELQLLMIVNCIVGLLMGAVISERKQLEKGMGENEKFLDSVIENIPDMVFVKDASDLRFVRFNKAGEELLGISKQFMYGKTDHDFFPSAEAEQFIKNDKKTLKSKQLLDIPEEKILTRNKGEKILHTKKIPILDEAGNPKYLLGISEDITEHKLTERSLLIISDTQRQLAQLDDLEDFYQLVGKKLLELVPDSYIVFSVLDEDEQATRPVGLFGFGQVYEKLKKTFKFDPVNYSYPQKDMTPEEEQLFRSGQLEEFPGGSYALLTRKVPKLVCEAAEKQLKITKIYTQGLIYKGDYLGVIAILARSDISSVKEMIAITIQQVSITFNRIKSRKALEESQERYRSLFEDSPISLWEEDFSEVKRKLDGLKSSGVDDIRGYLISHPQEISSTIALVRVRDVNRATLKLFKARSKDDIFKSHQAIRMSAEIKEHSLEELAMIFDGKNNFEFESTTRTMNDDPIDIHVFWSVAPGFESTLSKVLVSIVDITQRKQAEKEMRRLINDLRNLGEVEKENRIFSEALTRNVISISSSLKTEEILDSIIDNINNVLSADAVNIMMIEGDHLIMVRSRGYKERGLTDWVKNRKFNLDEVKTLKEVIRSKKYKVIPDTDKDKDWAPIVETAWIKSNIVVPILDDLTVIGFVNVDSITPGFYKDAHARHLEVFTDQISTALKNARLFESTQRRMNRMQSMTQINQAINSSTDLNVSLEIVVINTREQLHADAVDILLINEATNSLVFSKAQGFKTDEIRKANLSVGSGLPGRAVLERVTVAFPDLKTTNESYFKNMLIEREGFVSYYCVPLVAKGQLKGVMEIYFRQSFQADQEWLDFLEMLAQQTAIAINNADLLNSLQKNNIELLNAYETTLKGWVDALDMRDHETQGHTQRVTELSIQLARFMGIKDAEDVNFRRGALLHDIGKVAVPDAILNKPGPLTEEEWVIMRKHPLHAYSLLSKSNYLEAALDIPLYHHEKWDGSGYPGGLKGDAIPQAARIFAIVDVWDALTSDRPYRKAWTKKKALQYIQEQSGKHFDPQVVSAFITILRDEQIGSN